MSLSLVSLASGSTGNSTLIMSENASILVDVGISYKRIKDELQEFGISTKEINGVIITHEHRDHIEALPLISKDCEIYAHPQAVNEILTKKVNSKFYLEEDCFADVDNFMDGFNIGDIFVRPFYVSHDAVAPVAYTFECDDRKISIVTDTGTFTKEMFDYIKESEIVLIEANHDIKMLKNGSYSYFLKERILSSQGHMSNYLCAKVVNKLIENGKVKKILLGHLSKENNTPELAYKTVSEVIKNSEVELYLTYPDRKSEVCVLT